MHSFYIAFTILIISMLHVAAIFIYSGCGLFLIGVVDKLFARVGASDNVANRQSTFHMEMSETAHILNNATPNSFVILDEIGKGKPRPLFTI